MDTFSVNPIGYQYLLAIFTDVVKKRINNLLGRLTRLIKLTDNEVKDMIKDCIHFSPEYGHQIAICY